MADRIETKPFDYSRPGRTPGIKFYHASPVRFRHGDILVGGRSGGAGTAHSRVCMTTSPEPHATIRSNIPGWPGFYDHSDINVGDELRAWGMGPPTSDRDWYVYEVEPIGPVVYVHGNAEYQARRAKVLKTVGKATAFLPRKLEEKTPHNFGRMVAPPESIAHPPYVERERVRKREERLRRHQERLERDDIEASAARVASRFLSVPKPSGR